MSRLFGLHPLIADAVSKSTELDDFVVWARAADGTWADLFDMKERIHVNVWIDTLPGIVFAQAEATIPGFGGSIKGMALKIPNEHLHTDIMQVLTILEFLPREDNINDHTHKVYLRWMQEDREKRKHEEGQIYDSLAEYASMLPDEEIEGHIRDLCAENGISLEGETSVDIYSKADSYLRRVARKMRKARKED